MKVAKRYAVAKKGNAMKKTTREMITVKLEKNSMSFYYNKGGETFYMFSQKYCRAIYEYFRAGRSVGQVYSFKKWKRNRRLDKTIEKLPAYIKYCRREMNFVDEQKEGA